MKLKYTTALLAITCIAWLGLSGCSRAPSNQSGPIHEPERFECVYSQGDGMGNIAIFRDRKTGHQYLWSKVGYAGGLTTMPDEKP